MATSFPSVSLPQHSLPSPWLTLYQPYYTICEEWAISEPLHWPLSGTHFPKWSTWLTLSSCRSLLRWHVLKIWSDHSKACPAAYHLCVPFPPYSVEQLTAGILGSWLLKFLEAIPWGWDLLQSPHTWENWALESSCIYPSYPRTPFVKGHQFSSILSQCQRTLSKSRQ